MHITSRNPQSGFTLIELLIAVALIAIAAALIFGGLSSSKIAHAKNCETTILTIQNWEKQWEVSKAAGNPDVGVCREMNTLIGKYNARCGGDFGNLATANCG